MVDMKNKIEFKPNKYIAKCCKSILQSKYPGQFVSCSCGESFIDETEYYVRGGGDVELIEEKPKLGEDHDD
jgi:hypothetical protein